MFGPRYTVGNVVQLVRGGPAAVVVWRGQQLVQHPSGWHREWVYRLDDKHWDCYREDELHPAWRWTND
jgi:uncharacterized protein YodC (DUF2158 family)